MTDQPKIGTVAWLKKFALFGCVSCSDDYSWPADHMRLLPDGERVCCNCYDQMDPVPNGEGGEAGWDDLLPFDPFARWEEAERLLREVTGYHGLMEDIESVSPTLRAEIEKWSEGT